MCTLILAFINAKYKHNYEVLFLVTIVFDICILDKIL
jgi:hypothetical protein